MYIEMSAEVDSLVRPNVKGTNTLDYINAQTYALACGLIISRLWGVLETLRCEISARYRAYTV